MGLSTYPFTDPSRRCVGIYAFRTFNENDKGVHVRVLNSDYIKMAKAKGVEEFFLIAKHAFRNALIPVITTIRSEHRWSTGRSRCCRVHVCDPGMGQLMVNSIGRRDYYVIQAIVLIIACINVFINLMVDLLYGLADPRVRLG